MDLPCFTRDVPCMRCCFHSTNASTGSSRLVLRRVARRFRCDPDPTRPRVDWMRSDPIWQLLTATSS